jgi:hypothetical protein
MKTVKRFPGHRNPPQPPQQNTLNRDKVIEVMDDKMFWAFNEGRNWDLYKQDVADALCSLSLPTLSEDQFMDKFTENIAFRGGISWHSIEEMRIVMDSAKATLKELTKPKEE